MNEGIFSPGKRYCPNCKKDVGTHTNSSDIDGDLHWEVSCAECDEILDED